MQRFEFEDGDHTLELMQSLCDVTEQRIMVNPLQRCPVDMVRAYLRICQGQSCGKCSACRVGLRQLEHLLDDILAGRGDEATLALLKKTAWTVSKASDCAIGYNAADMLLKYTDGFMYDFQEHIHNGSCTVSSDRRLPCVSRCPAHVDVPGYIALAAEGRFEDAVQLIRKDNPFPAVCGYVCEHPCELHCRRRIIDEPVNIRGIKRFVVDHATHVNTPTPVDDTGKAVAVIGAGPCGMTAAYYLALMGHKVTVYEQRTKLGGMLRYGIPAYRLPRESLDDELHDLLAIGIEVKTEVSVGKDVTLDALYDAYDAVCIAIGAHDHKRLNIPGEDGEGVLSALGLLRRIGEESSPTFKGRRVAVVGGGNVAMDAARTVKRLGAEHVTIAYRRRKTDMTALPEEVDGAIAEGCEVLQLHAPKEILLDDAGRVSALLLQPQIVGRMDAQGRPRPENAPEPPVELQCDTVVIAVGQSIQQEAVAAFGIPMSNGLLAAAPWSGFTELTGVFSGGDCVSGPVTVIRAVAAGKVLAANIDRYLGYEHEIQTGMEIPAPRCADRPAIGRVDTRERDTAERQGDFRLIEYCMTETEVKQECSRCLRCDHFGYGLLKGGRNTKW